MRLKLTATKITIFNMSKHDNNTKGQFRNRITMSPEICHGKPCIRGMRYPVEMILELLSSGMTLEEILNDYSDLEKEDILAVLSYASTLSKVKRIQPVPA